MESGDWIYGYPVKCGHSDDWYIVYNYTDDILDKIWIDPETVGQWTGQIDKAGIEIYEGDKILVRGNKEITKKEYLNQKYELQWDNVYSKFVGKPLNTKFTSGLFIPHIHEEGEVIGNIHDKTK